MNLAYTAMQLAALAATDDCIFLTDDDQQAHALSAILGALVSPPRVVFIPSSDALPGDAAPPSPGNAGRRVAALRALRAAMNARSRPGIVCIMSGEAAAQRYAAPEAFDAAPPCLIVGHAIDPEALTQLLVRSGYVADDRVDEPGEIAVRGEVIDVFPADAEHPVRVKVADGRVISIRAYDPVTQRTLDDPGTLDDRATIAIGDAAEPPVGAGVAVLDHLQGGRIGLSPKAEQRRQRFVQLARDAADSASREMDAIDDDTWASALANWQPIDLEPAGDIPRFAEAQSPLAALKRFVEPLLADKRAFILAGTERDVRFLKRRVGDRLRKDLATVGNWADLQALKPDEAGGLIAPVDAGFVSDRHVMVAAADLLGSRALLGDGAGAANILETRATSEIGVGDVVIHEDHGLGVVVGLDTAPVSTEAHVDVIVLEYAHEARRLVPIGDAGKLWRYGLGADAVTLDRLDGSSWQERRGDIDAAIAATARSLTELAAARASIKAPVLAPDAAAYERFVGGFAFNETADQARAIGAVRDDLASGRPMDRLVVGDVGYGKTEVALRAAALAALAGNQVVVAAPTTVLVRQHLETFRKRFSDSGIVVAGLSRLSSAAEKKMVKAGLADGSIHIVIGTGAVMAKGVTYAKLGLVVIDEEQRFGAADKARLRGSGEIHLLTLTATPIPRTLQMALVGLQQISIIATPPARRQPIRTVLDHFDEGRIRTALLREKGVGGQTFMVVPRIEDMADCSERLRRVAPEMALVEAHGKMPVAQIDEAMVRFAQGDGDILLATNIIEAGLDVPRANTMIVWNADRFGLAQLHQLRGRVGRGHRRGQVILLTAPDAAIAERTLKRLRTLATFDRLGAGFAISAQDLDMRGAGDLLGEEQAGHTKLIGIDLYQHLLDAALRKARGEDVDLWSPELNLGSPGALPESWIPSVDQRLSFYVRIARVTRETDLHAIEDELADRFGPLPALAEALLAHAGIRIAAREMTIQRIDVGPAGIALTPHGEIAADPKSAGLTQKDGRYLLLGEADDRLPIERVRVLLEALGR